MQRPTIHIAAPARLHFGMFSFGDSSTRQFGGIGAMIAEPALRLTCTPADRWSATGPMADRALEFAERVASALGETSPCHFTIHAAPPSHVGLGSGTQLGMAVAKCLSTLAGRDLSAMELAKLSGRGRRSAVGVHGFALGRLLVESGKVQQEDLSPLVARHEIPDAWRFVLIRAQGTAGLAGAAERAAFERLPAVPRDRAAELCRLALLELLPALCDQDCVRFGRALTAFGRLSGESFATQQVGVYASDGVAKLVERVQRLGAAGAAQSSWGPLVAAVVANQAEAERLVHSLSHESDFDDLEIVIAPPNNTGATLTITSP